MRAMTIAAGCAALAACGGAETSQANNSQANISNDAVPANSASPSAVARPAPKPVSGTH
jgi:spermidine/putrescine-binding protein